jgi:hypothetical protein
MIVRGSMRGCSWTSSRTAVSGATGSHEEPPRNVREWASGDRGAMLVSSDLCLSGASIAGCQDPGDMCSTSTTSKFPGAQRNPLRRTWCLSHLALCNTRRTFLAGPVARLHSFTTPRAHWSRHHSDHNPQHRI